MQFENTSARVIVRKGRERSIHNFHPWLFSGAVDRVEGDYENGDIVPVYTWDGTFLAKGFVNLRSQINVRFLTFENMAISEQFFIARFKQANSLRREMLNKETNAYRLIHSDGDFLPGLIVDKYCNAMVIQIFSKGMHNLRSHIINWLCDLWHPEVIIERSEGQILREEGLGPQKQVLFGHYDGPVEVQENGVRYKVDLWEGQKTGLFLDQRENRLRVGRLARGKKLLNCFSYTGGFSLTAALNGASTVSVEINQPAQDIAKENFELNNIDVSGHQFITANVFEYLRRIEDRFDFIILDPPAFIKKKANIQSGARGYKDINRLAMMNAVPGGILLTCSCSHHMNWELFQKVIFAAASESRRRVQILAKYSQPFDHPVSIYHPEGEYLKSFLLRIL